MAWKRLQHTDVKTVAELIEILQKLPPETAVLDCWQDEAQVNVLQNIEAPEEVYMTLESAFE